MGATFINLQVKAKIEDIPMGIIPREYVCKQTTKNWSSVFEATDNYSWGKLCSLGRKISKERNIPVIAVKYYDDDEFMMSLLNGGKTVASYQRGIAGSWCDKTAKWIEVLGLSKEEASAFRYLAKKEMSVEESIDAFSRLLGSQLFLNLQMAEIQKEFWFGDAEGVIREISEEKKRTRVKNKTKANLLIEIPGVYRSCDVSAGILQMVYPDLSGKFLYNHIHCLEICECGLIEVHDFQYPSDIFGEGVRSLWVDYERKSVSVGDGKTWIFRKYALCDCEEELNALMKIPEGKSHRKNGEPKVFSVYSGSVIDQGRYEYFRWDAVGINKGAELRKVDLVTSGKTFLEKDITAIYEYEKRPSFGMAFWLCGCETPVLINDGIVDVRLQHMKETHNIICDVRFFDKDLKIKRRVKIDLKENNARFLNSIKYTYCEENDCVYLGNRKIDLQTHEICTGIKELNEADRIFIHYNIENAGFLYAVKGSCVYVLDLNMNLLSCHRLKGNIMHYYVGREGNICLITIGDQVFDDEKPGKKSAVRVYEIMMRL